MVYLYSFLSWQLEKKGKKTICQLVLGILFSIWKDHVGQVMILRPLYKVPVVNLIWIPEANGKNHLRRQVYFCERLEKQNEKVE